MDILLAKCGTNFAYNKNNMKNVVDGKIEIDCLIRGIANGFSSFILYIFFFPRRRDYGDRGKAKICMSMCHRRQLGLMRANHKRVHSKNAGA